MGGSSIQTSDFRLISATNRNLEEDVKAGKFREDLYFRLAVFELELPPLRQRREDIPALTQFLIEQERISSAARIERVSPAALAALMSWHWPGNIRELKNVILRAMVMADGTEIQPSDLPERIWNRSDAAGFTDDDTHRVGGGGTLEDSSRSLLAGSLKRHSGNASAVIRELQIGRPRFYRLLKKYKLEGMIEELRQASKTGERLPSAGRLDSRKV